MEPTDRARQEESARSSSPRVAPHTTFALDVPFAVLDAARLDHGERTA
jgi:hypothetical protein